MFATSKLNTKNRKELIEELKGKDANEPAYEAVAKDIENATYKNEEVGVYSVKTAITRTKQSMPVSEAVEDEILATFNRHTAPGVPVATRQRPEVVLTEEKARAFTDQLISKGAEDPAQAYVAGRVDEKIKAGAKITPSAVRKVIDEVNANPNKGDFKVSEATADAIIDTLAKHATAEKVAVTEKATGPRAH